MAGKTDVHANNKGRVCDAVVRVLEEATGYERAGITCPERAGGPGAVELLFSLGRDRYVLEHTRIEAFPRQMQYDAYFSEFIGPVMDELRRDMPRPGIYDLFFPLNMRFDGGRKRLPTLRAALIEWVRAKARELHGLNPRRLSREERPHGVRDLRTGRPDGFPFDVTLARSVHWSQSGVHDGILLPIRIAPDDIEPLRRERIGTALRSKQPKLGHRKAQGARTILVLENGDMILSNHALVGEHIAALLSKRQWWLDQLFLMDTTTSNWTLLRWDWEIGWWFEGYRDFDSRGLEDVCAA